MRGSYSDEDVRIQGYGARARMHISTVMYVVERNLASRNGRAERRRDRTHR